MVSAPNKNPSPAGCGAPERAQAIGQSGARVLWREQAGENRGEQQDANDDQADLRQPVAQKAARERKVTRGS
jgi:hypothetical protein